MEKVTCWNCNQEVCKNRCDEHGTCPDCQLPELDHFLESVTSEESENDDLSWMMDLDPPDDTANSAT